MSPHMGTERFKIVDDLSELAAEQWRRFAQGHPGLHLAVLQSLSEQSLKPLRFKAFVVEDAAGIAAAAVCQSVTQASQYSSLDSLLFGRARQLCAALRLHARPYLAFSLPLGGGAAIAARTASADEMRHRLTTLLDGVETYATEHHFGVAFMRIEEGTLASLLLRERGYLESKTPSTATLAVEWDDFDGYLAYLHRSSPKAASMVRNERTRARKQGVEIRRIPCDEAGARALYDFASRHYREKNGSDPVYTADFFVRLAAMLGEDFLLFEARRHGARTALSVGVRSVEVVWATWVGFAPGERPNDFTYFNLCYYAMADYAPAANIRTVLYGNGAYDAKLRRGCRITECSVFYRPHSGFMRAVATPFFRMHRAWYRRKLR